MRLFRGWFGEKKTALNMWFSLNENTYRRFHNVIIPSSNGTTQIDHLLVSPFGVFIVETKNLKGWIFGSEEQAKWTQTLYNEKYSFQNPLRQTYRQKKVLAAFLGIPDSLIHTVIYFVGDCRFKTSLPDNVLNSGLGRYIRAFKNRLLSEEMVNDISKELSQHLSESGLTKSDHIRSLRQRHNSTTVCPRCGSNLVERRAKNGPNAGNNFLGCSSYPRCRFTKSLK